MEKTQYRIVFVAVFWALLDPILYVWRHQEARPKQQQKRSKARHVFGHSYFVSPNISQFVVIDCERGGAEQPRRSVKYETNIYQKNMRSMLVNLLNFGAKTL